MIEIKEYQIVKEVIPLEIEDNSILNIVTRDVNTHTHGFHKYPAKFIPHIPKWAISKHLNGCKDKTVLDPFCGSGTTLVQANELGMHAIGIDVSPFNAFITPAVFTFVLKIELS